jgi:hypothetical protein
MKFYEFKNQLLLFVAKLFYELFYLRNENPKEDNELLNYPQFFFFYWNKRMYV